MLFLHVNDFANSAIKYSNQVNVLCTFLFLAYISGFLVIAFYFIMYVLVKEPVSVHSRGFFLMWSQKSLSNDDITAWMYICMKNTCHAVKDLDKAGSLLSPPVFSPS